MSAHTPGPWVYDFDPDGNRHVVYSDDGKVTELRFKDAEANARLIAAAPDLLEACQRMVKWAEDWKAGNTHPHDDWLFARAAIAKAIGGTP